MSRLFISYRRDDSPYTVKLLYEQLKARLPQWSIFYDHESIDFGEFFPQRLAQEVTTATVVLVVIGPTWTEHWINRSSGGIDFVREEIRLALVAQTHVVPIFVQGAKAPTNLITTDIPELASIFSLHGMNLRSEPDFEGDINKLVAFLEPLGPSIGIGTVLSGKYKLTRYIDEGGMGVVYQAEQITPKRTVAVKLIKPGMDSKDILARFDAERQALAVLDHPNIARVIDAGTTPRGRPFFVMDFVKGSIITQFCDDKKLSTQQRLEIFGKICHAVQHAHQKGIIHRDLKPSNILVETVDGVAEPRIIDFGLAKALNYKLTEKTLVSEHGRTVGTLLYSSPEQASGRVHEIDTRTDIYSLGVLLYEILVGSTPFSLEQLQSAGDEAMKKIICQDDPPRPSTKLSSSQSLPAIAAHRQIDPTKLTRLVRGDLDWIVMKSLEKEVERRYATVTSFAYDIQRFLRDEPIEASRPSAVYRVKKFVRRNRASVMAGCAMLLLIIAGLAGTTAGMMRAEFARKEEAEQRKIADEQSALAGAATAAEKERSEQLQSALSRIQSEKEQAELSLSRSRLLLAQSTFAGLGSAAQADSILDEIPSRFRNWEFSYLRSIQEGSIAAFYGHTSTVLTAIYSPDGRRIASGSDDGTIRIWNVATGDTIHRLTGHTNSVRSLSFSPDGKRIASGSSDKKVKIWDVESGAILSELNGHSELVSSVCHSPDGTRLVSGSFDLFGKKPGEILLWNAKSGQIVRELQGHTSGVRCVSFSSDGKWIASASDDKSVIVWNAESGERIHELAGHALGVRSLCFSPDGSQIASCSDDQRIIVWERQSGQILRDLRGHIGNINCISFSPDGSRLASASSDGSIRVWDARSGQPMFVLKGHLGGVYHCSFSTNGEQLVTASDDCSARIWNARNDSNQLEVSDNTSGVNCVRISPDGKLFAAGLSDGKVLLRDLATTENSLDLGEHADRVVSLCFSADGSRLASGSWDKTVRLWDVTRASSLFEFSGHTGKIQSVAFSADGQNLVSTAEDNIIRVWDLKTGACTLQIDCPLLQCVVANPVRSQFASASWDNKIVVRDYSDGKAVLELSAIVVISLSISRDGTRIASGSADGGVTVWDLDTGLMVFNSQGHNSAVTAVSFSPDGSRIFSGSNDKSVVIWDALTGQKIITLGSQRDWIRSLDLSPQGDQVVSGARDGTVRFWHPVTRQRGPTLVGHQRDVRAICFSPDGTRIATAGDDAIVMVWNANTGEKLLSYLGHEAGVWRLCFSTDGSEIASGSSDNVIRVWKTETGQEVSVGNRWPDWAKSQTGHAAISPDQKSIWIRRKDRTVQRVPLDATQAEINYRKSMLNFDSHWHQQQAEIAQTAKDWFAFNFHWNLLCGNRTESLKELERIVIERSTDEIIAREVKDIVLAQFEIGNPYASVVACNIAKVLLERGLVGLSISLLEAALEWQKANLGIDNEATLQTIPQLAAAYANSPVSKHLEVALWRETWMSLKGKLGDDNPTTVTFMGNLAVTYCEIDQGLEATPVFEQWLAAWRKNLVDDDATYADKLAVASLYLLRANQFVTCERYLRACWEIRKSKEPDLWSTYNVQSMLGGALLGQKKYDEAEPHLLAGYSELRSKLENIPPQAHGRLLEAVDRLVELAQIRKSSDDVQKWTQAKTELLKLLNSAN